MDTLIADRKVLDLLAQADEIRERYQQRYQRQLARWRHQLEEVGFPEIAGGATGTAVATGDIITAAKMNLKQETGVDLANLSINDTGLDQQLALVVNENLSADRTLNLIVNDADRTINLTGNLTLAGSLTTSGAFGVTLTATALTSVTLPTTGTLATLAGSENLTSKTITSATLSGTFPGSVTLSGATITLTGTNLALTGGAAYTIRTTDAFVLNLGANAGNRMAMTTTLGDILIYQTTANVTLRFSDPAAARTITFPDPLGADSVTYLAATQTLTNKTVSGGTLSANALSGTLTGTPTLSGATITFTGGAIALTGGAAYSFGTTDAFALNLRAGGANRLGVSNTIGTLVVYQTTGNYTFSFADPGAGRAITVSDPGGADTLAWIAATQNLSNKTFITSPLNFTVGGAVVIGTTDANTFALKTGNTTRWTFAAASSNLTAAGATVLAFPAATAATLAITDGTTSLIALDSRVAVDNVVVHTLTAVAPTIASAAGTTFRSVLIAAYTITLTGGTGVTAMDGMALYLDAPTVTSAAATTITTASTLYIKPPTAAGGGPASFSNSRMINTSVAGCFLTSAGTWTDASSIEHKTDIIRDLDWDAVLADIARTNLVTYVRRDASDGGFRRYGVIAEEAPDFLASADHKGVSAQYFAAAAFGGVKALIRDNVTLRSRVAELEGRLEKAGIA